MGTGCGFGRFFWIGGVLGCSRDVLVGMLGRGVGLVGTLGELEGNFFCRYVDFLGYDFWRWFLYLSRDVLLLVGFGTNGRNRTSVVP